VLKNSASDIGRFRFRLRLRKKSLVELDLNLELSLLQTLGFAWDKARARGKESAEADSRWAGEVASRVEWVRRQPF
jgi:hypothetical protein